MTIRPFLRDAAFTPELISLMSRALDEAMASLEECGEATKSAMAALIIAATQRGERDVSELVRLALLAAAPPPSPPKQRDSGQPTG